MTVSIHPISTPDAPTPAGHYSQAVEVDGFVFVSGMLPTRTPDGTMPPFEDQVRSVIDHSEAVLRAAGCTLADVVQCTAYIAGVDHWPTFNAIYAERMGAHKPARAVIPVVELRHGALIELQLNARRR